MKKADDQFVLLEEMFEQMQNLFLNVANFYCFEIKKKPMEEFFSEMNTFRTDYLVILT